MSEIAQYSPLCFHCFQRNYFCILFVITAAGVVPCGGRKSLPCTASIVQIIFYFRSFEISGNILKSQYKFCVKDNTLDFILLFNPFWNWRRLCNRLA